MADSKNLSFKIEIDPRLPRSIVTDQKRLHQVLKNLLSNAFKFTAQGEVELKIHAVENGWNPEHPQLSATPQVIAFSVRDTGIGIAPDKQKIVFEAFQQADAGTSRRYGGTGLGLAISRELAGLLGGEIRLSSIPNQGSTFTLYLPHAYVGPTIVKDRPGLAVERMPIVLPMPKQEEVPDDRESIKPGDPCVLIIEDDPHYARVLLGIARDKGFKGLVAGRGSAGLALAREYPPTTITLDINLPDMLGWTVLSHLKQDASTRHIPVQIITITEERQHGLEHGAFAFMVKPMTTGELDAAFERMIRFTTPRVKQLLVVEDNEVERTTIEELLAHDDIQITSVGSGAAALELLKSQPFDCVVLDLRLPDLSGFDVLEQIRQQPSLHDLPIVVFTGKELAEQEVSQLRRMAKGIIVKGVQSPERLLDATALFMHRVTAQLPQAKQKMLELLHQSDTILSGRKALVVDDDVRNIFALTSLLERHEMRVESADNGRDAIELLEQEAEIDIVLMDIMMPEMDGYETIRAIRSNPRHRLLPIIALTAKAMKGDREKCLEAGASDYIAKPVNSDQLLSLMRVWLHR
jgi:CheY-like chemotaxis protein